MYLIALAIDLGSLFKGLSLWNLVAIAAGAIVLLQATGIKDFSNMPIIGAILKAVGIIKTDTMPLPLQQFPLEQEQQQAYDAVEVRCQKLVLELIDLRHFASERPTENAMHMLKACDVLTAELEQYHKEHEKRKAS